MGRWLTIRLRQRVMSFAARLFPHRFFVVSAEEYDRNELIADISEDNLRDAVFSGERSAGKDSIPKGEGREPGARLHICAGPRFHLLPSIDRLLSVNT